MFVTLRPFAQMLQSFGTNLRPCINVAALFFSSSLVAEAQKVKCLSPISFYALIFASTIKSLVELRSNYKYYEPEKLALGIFL
jgi:hypothetical protein